MPTEIVLSENHVIRNDWLDDLRLDRLIVVSPCWARYVLAPKSEMMPLEECLAKLRGKREH